MKIGKKLFITLLAFSLISIVVSGAAGVLLLTQTRSDVGKAQDAQAEELTRTNLSVMTAANENIVTAIAQGCSESIESKLDGFVRSLLIAQGFLEDLYEGGLQTNSQFPDDMCYLQPGVSRETIEAEFQTIKPARDLMADIIMADDTVSVLYYVTESGFMISGGYMDYDASKHIDRRERVWYNGAIECGDVYWTGVYQAALTGQLTITCSVLIKSGGKIMGVIGCDILVGKFVDSVLAPHSSIIEYIFLTDENGEVFIDSAPELSIGNFISVGNIESLQNEILNWREDVGLYNDGAAIVGFSKISVTGWSVGAVIDYKKISEPVESMREAINGSRNGLQSYLNGKIRGAVIISAVLSALVLIIALAASRPIVASVVNPIEILAEGARIISLGDLNHCINIKSGDELEHLADAFNGMTVKLSEHIKNLALATAEKERNAAELNIAAQIQMDMLPHVYPEFSGRSDFELYALIRPAKKVGGDFYDFFMLDNDHLCIVIADVSGKGVPAALFMVNAKTLIKNSVLAGNEPAEAFEAVNTQLCDKNEAGMFITAFMGVLQISTGKLCFVNAGHNPPLLRRGDDFEWLRSNRGFVLAGMKDSHYSQNEITIPKGGELLLYTDGVTEAANKQYILFSEKRLLDETNKNKDASLKEMLCSIEREIDAFAGGAEQADDITMLAVKRL